MPEIKINEIINEIMIKLLYIPYLNQKFDMYVYVLFNIQLY